jgi:lysophospholipid acyltransferase
MVVTQLVSGAWHGLFPGYWLFFLTSAFMFQASRLVYRYEQSWAPRARTFPPWVLFKVVATALVLDYAGVAFVVLTWRATMEAWRAVYFFGHVVILLVMVVGAVLPPRSSRRRAKVQPEGAAAAGAEAPNGAALEKVAKAE